jgi:polar amino acid transport system permease protein
MLRLVIMPQALSRMWGPLSNEFILLVKFSSLASLVSVPDLTFQAYQVGVTTRSMFEVWIVVAGMYFVISAGLAALFRALERRSAKPFER